MTGTWLADVGLDEEADAVFNRAVESGNPMAAVARAKQREKDDFEGRLGDLEHRAWNLPGIRSGLLRRGMLYWEEYELEKALADADRMLEMHPRDRSAY